MRRHRLPLCALTVLIALVPTAALAVTFTLNGGGSSQVGASAADGAVPDGALDQSFPASVPSSGTEMVTDGASTSTTSFSLSDTSFSVSMDHARVASAGASAQTFFRMYFSPSADVNYSINGSYSSDAVGIVTLNAQIMNLTTSTSMYLSTQGSSATPNESFTLGGSGGDFFNVHNGSSSGTLLGGNEYLLNVFAHIDTNELTTAAAQATGSVTLSFVPVPPPVPSLGTSALACLAIIVAALGSIAAHRGLSDPHEARRS